MSSLLKGENKVIDVFERLQKTRNYYLGEREYLFNVLKAEMKKSEIFWKNKNISGLISEISKIAVDSLGWLNKVVQLRKEVEKTLKVGG